MSLMEVMVAALLFSMSAVSSLQIWSQVTMGVLQEERRQQLLERLDAELAAVEASLRQQKHLGLPEPICGTAADAMKTLLAARPAGDGVERQLIVLREEDSLLVEMAIEGLPIRRQRLYQPAALGLCRSDSPAETALSTPSIDG
ncbi:MAG: type II secretion system protein J [Cyanobium sp.]